MKNHLKSLLHATLGALLGSLATLFLIGPFLVDERLTNMETKVKDVADNNERIESRLDYQVERFMHRYATVSDRVATLEQGDWSNEDSAALLEQVITIQKSYVQDSWGVNAGEFYTDHDYATFTRDKQANVAVSDFAESEVYTRLKPKLSTKADDEIWDSILNDIRAQYQKTWTQVGGISRKGQTASGQQAQRDIANAIADFLQQSRTELEGLTKR